MKEITRYVSTVPGLRPEIGKVFGGVKIEGIEVGARLHESDGTMLVWNGENWQRPFIRARIKKRPVRQLSTPDDDC